jgi:hypothetical protein
VGKTVSAVRGQLVALVCCFNAVGKGVATTVIFPCNRLCHALHSEAKCEQIVVRRHLVNKTNVSTTNIIWSVCGEELPISTREGLDTES